MKTHSIFFLIPSALEEGGRVSGSFKLSGTEKQGLSRSSSELRPSCKVLLLAWPSLSAKRASARRSN